MLNLWESLAVAFCAFVGVRTLRIYFVRRMIRSDFDYGMQVIAKEAVRRARKDFHVELDFSTDSIERLEEMLARLHEAYLKTPLTEKELAHQSLRWGAYVGEVAKRVQPGKWQRDSEKMGRGAMPVVFHSANEAFPCSWVRKRIADGPDDNIFFKFRVLTDFELQKHVGSTRAIAIDEPPEEKE